MAFGDVFAGWSEAAHQHTVNLLQMDYENKRELAQRYAKLAEDQSYPTEARTEFAKRALHIPALEPGKKLPKEWENMLITVQPPTPAPINAPGTPGTSATTPEGTPQAAQAEVAPQTVQPPTPPPHAQSVYQPMSPVEFAQQKAAATRIEAPAEAQAAGMKAGAISEAQDPARLRDIYAKQHMAQIKQESDLAKIGYRPKYDLNGNELGIEPIPEAELSATQQSLIAKNNAANELAKTKGDLNRAEAAWNKSRTDPNSPVNVRLLAQVEALRRRVAISETNLGLRQEDHLARYYGIDKDGNPLPGAVTDPMSGQPVGTAFQRIYQPTSATLTKAQTAAPVISQANDLIEFASNPDNEDLFGKVGGRWTELMAGKVGADDPRMAQLAPKIRSLASLLAPLHGFRSANAAEEFARTMPLMDSPEAFAAAVREYAGVASRVEEAGKPNEAKRKSKAPAAPTPPVKNLKSMSTDDLFKALSK